MREGWKHGRIIERAAVIEHDDEATRRKRGNEVGGEWPELVPREVISELRHDDEVIGPSRHLLRKNGAAKLDMVGAR